MSETKPIQSRKKLTELRVVDLKIELEKRNLEKSGNKTTLIERLKNALQDEGKYPDHIEPPIEFTKPSFKPTAGSAKKPAFEKMAKHPFCPGTDVCQEGNTDDISCYEHMESTESKKKEINKDEDIHGEKTEKKSDIQENKKSVCSTRIAHSGSVSETSCHLLKKLESSAISTEVTDKLGTSCLQATDNTAFISSEKPKLKQDYLESKDVSAVNKSLGNIAIKECAATLKEKELHKNIEYSKPHEMTAHSGSENSKQTTIQEINISSNPTNKSAETATDNQSSLKTENKTDDTKAEEKIKHVVCGENNLWVSGLDGEKTRAADLKALFSRNNCKVISAKIVTNKKPAFRQRFFGFVTMATSGDAAKCVQAFNKTELHGKTISVEKTTRFNFSPNPPGTKAPVTVNQNENEDSEVNKIVGTEKAKLVSDKEKHALPEATIQQEETHAQNLIGFTSQMDEKQTFVKHVDLETAVKQDEAQKITKCTLEMHEKQISVAEKSENDLETNGEVMQEVCKTSEIKFDSDEKMKTDELTSINPVTDVVEEKTTEKRDIRSSKERDIHLRDRFREGRRSHRSRSRSREYVMRDSRHEYFFRHRGPRSYGPRRPFMSNQLFIDDKFHHGRFRHEDERYIDYKRHDIRAKELARRNREETFKIEHERELLRIDKEKLERMRADVLRKEREQQRIERERIERERMELRRRSQLTEIDERRELKRCFEGREQKYYYLEERKRVAIPCEPGSELPSGYGEFPRPRPAYPERRGDRFEGRPKAEISPDFVEPNRREGHPDTEVHTFPHGNRHHDSPEGKARERALDRPHGHHSNFNRLHHWESIQNDRPPNKFGPPPPPPPPPPPASGSHWGPVRKDDNWGHIEGQPPPPPPVGPERWPNMEYSRGQPPMNLNHPPNVGPPSQIYPMYGEAGSELLGGNIPGHFPARFNAVRRF